MELTQKTIELTDNNISNLENIEHAVIDFWAEWCGPCLSFMPIFEEASNEFSDVTFLKLNIDNLPSVAQNYGVRSIPTVILLNNGKEIARNVGSMDKIKLIDWINKNKS